MSCIQVVTGPTVISGPNGITEIEMQRQGDGQERRQQVEQLVDVRRNQVFLGDQLDDVGQRLQQAVRAHAVGAEAHLDVRDHLALHPLQVGERGQKHEGDHRRLDQAEYEKVHE